MSAPITRSTTPETCSSDTAARVGARPARVNYRPNVSVQAIIARELGVEERTVGQMVKPSCSNSPARRLATICKVLIANGQRARAEALCADLFGLFNAAPVNEPTDALLVEEADLDAELLKARQRFALNHCYETAKAVIRVAGRHESCERQLCRALAETWESA